MTVRGAQVSPQPLVSDIQSLLSLRHKPSIIRYQLYAELDGTWNELLEQQIEYFCQNILPILGKTKCILQLMKPHSSRSVTFDWWMGQLVREFPSNVYFGLINEPQWDTSLAWQKKLIYEIRKQQPKRMLVITPRHSNPIHFNTLKPVGDNTDKNILYEAHMYDPMNFTHQGLYGYPEGIKYPSGRYQKNFLYNILRYVRKFQVAYGTNIIISEFAASKFADSKSRFNYYRDCIDIFTQYGWNWSYHAFREAPVWDVESQKDLWLKIKRSWS